VRNALTRFFSTFVFSLPSIIPEPLCAQIFSEDEQRIRPRYTFQPQVGRYNFMMINVHRKLVKTPA